jgi:hypothetical protein
MNISRSSEECIGREAVRVGSDRHGHFHAD